MRASILPCVVVFAACAANEPDWPYEPLLGLKSEVTNILFDLSCTDVFAPAQGWPGHFERYARSRRDRSGNLMTLGCEMSNGTSYGMDLMFGQVASIHISAQSEADRRAVFDRVIAALVPADVRDAMRASISNPESFRISRQNTFIRLDTRPEYIAWTTTLTDRR